MYAVKLYKDTAQVASIEYANLQQALSDAGTYVSKGRATQAIVVDMEDYEILGRCIRKDDD